MNSSIPSFQLPPAFDWSQWLDRWERMQERYLVRRAERFETIASLVRDTQPADGMLLDLACGPGSLTRVLLETLPQTRVLAVDADPTLLALAEKQLAPFGRRVELILADLRDPQFWSRIGSESLTAAVSATALHWLSAASLAALYLRVGQALRPRGIFLNADHVASATPVIQQAWFAHRERMRKAEGNGDADDWSGFMSGYAAALGTDLAPYRRHLTDTWEAVEDGMPLAWHFDHLRAAGLPTPNRLWRCDCDAIYGGLKTPVTDM